MQPTTTHRGVASAIRDYGTYRRMVRELAFLSDRDLTDIGVSRKDIRKKARSSVYGR